jgi:RNase P subunit RPR2
MTEARRACCNRCSREALTANASTVRFDGGLGDLGLLTFCGSCSAELRSFISAVGDAKRYRPWAIERGGGVDIPRSGLEHTSVG